MLARYEAVGGLVPQGVSAEIIAERWSLSRRQLDEIALRSHACAAAAADSGAFDAELAPVGAVLADEGIRRDSTLETLGGLRTVFREDGVVTAGNASQISDGAAALLVTTSEIAARHGWRPLARLHAFATAGVDPVTMLTAPIPATARVLERAGLTVDDIDAFEVNEAFASVVGAWLAETKASADRAEPPGWGDRARPPAGRLRRPADDHPGAPPGADRRPLRAADHVRGRRDGQRHRPRAALTPGQRQGLSTLGTTGVDDLHGCVSAGWRGVHRMVARSSGTGGWRDPGTGATSSGWRGRSRR